jgi:hypothetical protein
LAHITNIEEKIAEYDRVLSRVAKTDHRSQQLMELRYWPHNSERTGRQYWPHMILKTGANWQPGWG